MCLHPIKIFAGAFGGAVLFEDDTFVSPNARRAESKKAASARVSARFKRNRIARRTRRCTPSERATWMICSRTVA